MLVCGEREAMAMTPSTMHDSAISPCFRGCLAFLHWHFPSWSPPSHPLNLSLSAVNSSPHPGIAPQSLNSSSQPLHLPGDLCPCLGCVWLHLGLILIPFRLPWISCFTLSLKCFSSDLDNCPKMGTGPLFQFLHPPRAGPVLLILLFFPLVPLSYWVLCGSIYYFPLVRSSCLLSSGFLHVLLCLTVHTWCIRGEKCTPCPPTPSHFVPLVFNMLSRFVIAFHLRSKHLLISWLQSGIQHFVIK